MHIPDGFVSGPIASATGIAALTALTFSLSRVKKELQNKTFIVPLLATLAAFVFAAQMLNFPIGGGTSGHFLGAVTVMALLGPWSACLVLSLVLVIQALFFGDGGVTALGANIFNMGIIAGILCYPIMRFIRGFLPTGKNGYLATVATTSWISIMLASGVCALELVFSGTSPFAIVMPAMLGTHAVIGIGEALISVAVISAIIAARPDIAPRWSRVDETQQLKNTGRKITQITMGGLTVALLLAVFASPFASSHPDGLEKIAEDKDFIEMASEQTTVWKNSLFPDYSVPAIRAEIPSTGTAGLIGTMLVFAFGYGIIKSMTRKKIVKNMAK